MHRFVLALSCLVVLGELSAAVYYHEALYNWVSHNLWIVIIPFIKTIFKRIIALKLVALLKGISVLFWHFLKLLLLKLLKTLGIRYGVFFSQHRWYWIRRIKVLFLRRGRQLFRGLSEFWSRYGKTEKGIILIAFFPVALLVFFLGLSFDITRKTMVQKTQETAIFKAAATAGKTSRGFRAWIAGLDQSVIEKIRQLTLKKSESSDGGVEAEL